jgi:hypothetical protein
VHDFFLFIYELYFSMLNHAIIHCFIHTVIAYPMNFFFWKQKTLS